MPRASWRGRRFALKPGQPHLQNLHPSRLALGKGAAVLWQARLDAISLDYRLSLLDASRGAGYYRGAFTLLPPGGPATPMTRPLTKHGAA